MNEKLNTNIKGDPEVLAPLEDLSLLDIATNPEYSKEDQANAEATIAARQEAGTYDDSGEQIIDTEDDLLNHNYGVYNRKILAPAEENRNLGSVALDNYEEFDELYGDSPTHEKIHSNGGYGSDNFRRTVNENQQHKEEMRRAEQRKHKMEAVQEETPDFQNYKKWTGRERGFSSDKYEMNSYPSQFPEEIQNDIEARAEEINDLEQLSPIERMEKALDYARFRAKKTPIERLYSEGALDDIAKGEFNFNPNYIQDGFVSFYSGEINRRAGATKDMVWDAIRMDGYLPTVKSVEQLEDLEGEALKTSIALGVLDETEGRTGEKKYKMALPIERIGERKMAEKLEQFGLVLNNVAVGDDEKTIELDESSKELYECFEGGFVNIVDALKDDLDSQAGFKELNWYFERLLKGASEDDIADRVINQYEAGESDAFVNKFNQFMAWREKLVGNAGETTDSQNGVNEEDTASIDFVNDNSEELPIDVSLDELLESINAGSRSDIDEIIFPHLGRGVVRNPRKNPAAPRKNPEDYGRRKLLSLIEHMSSLEERGDFQKKEPYVTISKPFYVFPIMKNVILPDGTKRRVVDHCVSVPVRWDDSQGSYISERTGNAISEDSVKQYVSFYFSIDGIDVSLKESVTRMNTAFYAIVGEDAKSPNLSTFHDSIETARGKISKKPGSMMVSANHCKTAKNGIKGYHRFEKMYGKIFDGVLYAVDALQKNSA